MLISKRNGDLRQQQSRKAEHQQHPQKLQRPCSPRRTFALFDRIVDIRCTKLQGWFTVWVSLLGQSHTHGVCVDYDSTGERELLVLSARRALSVSWPCCAGSDKDAAQPPQPADLLFTLYLVDLWDLLLGLSVCGGTYSSTRIVGGLTILVRPCSQSTPRDDSSTGLSIMLAPDDDGRRSRVMFFPEAKRIRVKRDSRPGWLGFRQPLSQNARSLRLILVLLLAATGVRQAQGFRLVDENGTAVPFVPYEQGFVGR